MRERTMDEKFSYIGKWWLPDNPSVTYQGIINYIPGEDNIFELITSRQLFSLADNHQTDIFLGETPDGRQITLVDCAYIDTKPASIVDGTANRFDVKYIIINEHFNRVEDIKLQSIWSNYSHLDEWVNISGLTVMDNGRNETIVKYKRPEKIDVQLDDEYKLMIWFGQHGPTYSHQFQKEANIKQITFVQIDANQNVPFIELVNRMQYFHEFLSLAILEPVSPVLWISSKEEDEYKNLYIFYKLPTHPNPRKDNSYFLRSARMIFTYNHIENNFIDIINKWISSYSRLSHVYDLYFGTIFNPHLYLEQRFLNVIRALEVFHRRLFDGKYLSDDEYDEISSVIENSIPQNPTPGFNDKMTSMLTYGNEYSLRKRLNELFDNYLQDYKSLYTDRDFIINKSVDTRNYLTHFSKELEAERATGKDLYFLTQRIRMALIICILNYIGFSKEQIKSLRFSFPIPPRSE